MANSFRKLDPRVQMRNPVMFVVWVGALLTLVLFFQALAGMPERLRRVHPGHLAAAVVHGVFANFAEALAEGRGRAQAETLAQGPPGDRGATSWPSAASEAPARSALLPASCAGATGAWWRPASSSRPTARSSSGRPPWTRAPSPARARR